MVDENLAIDQIRFPSIRKARILKNVYVCKSGVALSGLRLVPESVYTNHPSRHFYQYVLAKRLLSKTVRLSNSYIYVSIHNHWSRGFHHWIVESLLRLVAIDRSLRPALKLVLPADFPRFAFDSLKGLVSEDQIVRIPAGHGAILPCALVIPNPDYQVFDGTSLINLRDTLMAVNDIRPSDSKPFRKLYISREFATMRRVENEAEVQHWMTSHGYEIVHAERLSFRDQIQLFREAAEVVSIHGAALTNLIFLQSQASVWEFCRTPEAGVKTRNPCFERMAKAVGVSLQTLFFPTGDNMGHCPGRANLVVSLDQLNQTLSLNRD